MGEKRERKYKSKKEALIKKSREAMLAAVQIYNNPLIKFKSESFLTLAVIAWTYLMHAYYEHVNVDYRYYKLKGSRKQYLKTEYGAIKEWELSKCIKATDSALNNAIKTNLEFIIGLRNEVEHQMTNILDQAISAKLQACALNFNHCITEWFGKKNGIENELVMSIQFSGVEPIKQKELSKMKGIAANVYNYISQFETDLTEEILQSKEYSYKIMYIPVSVNHRGQADSVVEFIKATPEMEEQVKNLVMIKESEKKKYLPTQIVKIMQAEGYVNFTIKTHTDLWQNNGNSLKNSMYGNLVAGKQWFWYESWVNYVREYCKANAEKLCSKIKGETL